MPTHPFSLAAIKSAGNYAVDTGTTPKVQYVYADGATGSKAAYLRLTQTIYPNGRTVNYNYATGVNAIMSRLSSISESNGTVDASYKYLGLGTIVKENYEQPDIKLDYDPSANNSLTGLDRFGRVIDQLWASYNSTPNPLEEYTYAFNRAGNATDRTNVNHAALNDHFVYDAVNRLTEWDEGSPLVQQKTWTLDALGNDLGSGTYNAANEETPTQGSSAYDAAGDMTTLKSSKTAKYDAWGRLVEVDSGATIVERNEYDGAGRRIQIFSNYTGGTPGTTVDELQSGQQTVETRENSAVKYQYVWSPRYVERADLAQHVQRRDDPDGPADFLPVRRELQRDGRGEAKFGLGLLERSRTLQLHALRHGDVPQRRLERGGFLGQREHDSLHRPRIRHSHLALLLPRTVLRFGIGEVCE